MNYTPGKWEARKLLPDRHGIITKEAWEITTPEYDVVAQIIGSAPIRKEADAYLIATAPDMYEALKATNAFMNALKKQDTKLFNDFRVVMLETTIEQALAKAEGK